MVAIDAVLVVGQWMTSATMRYSLWFDSGEAGAGGSDPGARGGREAEMVMESRRNSLNSFIMDVVDD